jgi:methylenetetrahydrofolate dehydrogenase (NADP+)/methenyltetrahydrofolate cyclohydrolase
MNKDSAGKLCGDVDFDKVAPMVKAITPVPGGIGPMTIFSLIQNLLLAAKKSVV